MSDWFERRVARALNARCVARLRRAGAARRDGARSEGRRRRTPRSPACRRVASPQRGTPSWASRSPRASAASPRSRSSRRSLAPARRVLTSVVIGDTVVSTLRDTLRLVRLMFDAPDARRVAVAGDFNRWDVDATPLARDARSRRWSVTLALRDGRAPLRVRRRRHALGRGPARRAIGSGREWPHLLAAQSESRAPTDRRARNAPYHRPGDLMPRLEHVGRAAREGRARRGTDAHRHRLRRSRARRNTSSRRCARDRLPGARARRPARE